MRKPDYIDSPADNQMKTPTTTPDDNRTSVLSAELSPGIFM
jgi:hypothetical protein